MPVTKTAKKALRRDRRRESVNNPIRSKVRRFLSRVRQDSTQENLSLAHSAIDRAAKKRVIHKNKAKRLKSRLSRVSLSN